MISFRSSPQCDKNALLLLCTQEQVKGRTWPTLPQSLKAKILSAITAGHFTGKSGQTVPIFSDKKIILLTGCGTKKKLSLRALRCVVRQALNSPHLKRIRDVEIVPFSQETSIIQSIIEGIIIGTYRWRKYRLAREEEKVFSARKIFLVAERNKILEDAITICEGTNLARDLINDNADVVTSVFLESAIRKIIKGKKNVSLEILNRKELKAKGLNLHLAVNQGSQKEPKLIIVKYRGASAKAKWTALVGKGITFDTGGLNLKSTGSMETMRYDMGGTAAVIGSLHNAINLKLKKNILFACGIAENAISAGAYKPGDVLKGYGGKTVEVANTDAEGRLVLADAIAYIVKNYKPDRLIDIATLTGACIIALGHAHTGLMSTDDNLASQLEKSAQATDDRVWRLPIYPELSEAVKSKIADIKNIGYPRGAAGTLTAGEFLHQFAKGVRWAHLDIAGTAFAEGQGRMYFDYGATGAGVRLLTHFVQNY